MRRPLATTAIILAIALPAGALAQTGYGRPTPQQYRSEQRTTAALNDAADDTYDAAPAAWDDRYATRDGYGRSPHDPAAMRAWHDHVEACRRGNRAACERAGELAAGVGVYRGSYADDGYAGSGYAFRGAGRYADPRNAYDPREDERFDDRLPPSRYDNRYARGDYDDAEEREDDGGW